ncbi:MAG: peptidoglycan-associated lipoprotein [Rhodospirillaceae bacterium]|nr:peptidoglycan-associated lipoprotein [Alphaproteobacteria bacterium]MBR73287.1 peptidoglycan-associated lipoprotein [Rhodospirillaceae bacterium]|tara:strand:+ start:103 stop:684 length:582 start_codon:yes stop_codon:yes gene_type:complete
MILNLKVFAPVAAVVLLVAACQSVPDSELESNSVGSDLSDSVATSSTSDSDIDTDSIDSGSLESEIEVVDPSAPIPGTQEDLVQNVGDRVFFGLDSATLSPQSRSVLDKQAKWLKLFPDVSITIEGHCDERGTREYNLALGEQRASAVRSYLIALGVEAQRLNTISYGKERPYALGHDEESWKSNRRSVSVIN